MCKWWSDTPYLRLRYRTVQQYLYTVSLTCRFRRFLGGLNSRTAWKDVDQVTVTRYRIGLRSSVCHCDIQANNNKPVDDKLYYQTYNKSDCFPLTLFGRRFSVSFLSVQTLTRPFTNYLYSRFLIMSIQFCNKQHNTTQHNTTPWKCHVFTLKLLLTIKF